MIVSKVQRRSRKSSRSCRSVYQRVPASVTHEQNNCERVKTNQALLGGHFREGKCGAFCLHVWVFHLYCLSKSTSSGDSSFGVENVSSWCVVAPLCCLKGYEMDLASCRWRCWLVMSVPCCRSRAQSRVDAVVDWII